MKKSILTAIIILTTIAVSIPVFAGPNTPCTGKVSSVNVNKNGSLYATIKNGSNVELNSIYLCNVTREVDEFTPESCRSAHSLATAALLSGKNITIYFDQNGVSCSGASWSDYHNAGPNHTKMYHIKLNE